MATTTVENTEARVYSLCDAPLKPDAELKDALQPGLNQVDAGAWAKVKKVPAVAGLIESGALREVAAAPAAPAAPAGPPTTLADLKAPDAIALVQTIKDKATLEAWYAHEERATVLAAIETQLVTVGG